jgi:hypothetical protein
VSPFRSAYPAGRPDDSASRRWRRARRWARLLPCVAAAFLAGCGDPTGGRQAISGTVTLKGEPLDEGVIEFFPQGDSVGERATKSGALIKDGKYQIPKDKGLMPGRYKVVITAGDRTTPDLPPDAPPGPTKTSLSKERIPADYNKETKQFVEVTKKGPNRFDYAIP